MIVKCEQCQTRFKVPDEKVSEKGVKVRCTKCKNTFRVTRPPPAAPSDAGEDPFAPFGDGDEPNSAETTRPVYFAEGVAATRAAQNPGASWAPGDFDADDDIFREVTRVVTLPVQPPELARTRATRPPRPLPPEPPTTEGLPPAPPPGMFAGDLGASAPPSPPPLPSQAAALATSAALSAPRTVETPAHPGPLLSDFPVDPDDEATVSEEDRASARALFDLPTHSRGLPDQAPPARVLESVDMSGVPEVAPGLPLYVNTSSETGGEDFAPPQPRTGGGLVRRLATVAVQLGVGALLVVAVMVVSEAATQKGKWALRSALSPERLRTRLFPQPATWKAVSLSNGFYETRDGSSVFFVRGEVENRSPQSQAVKVKIELYEGDQRVRSVEGLAGAQPTPEALYALTDAQSVAALRTQTNAAAKPVAPGERIPFLLVFDEVPADLNGFRLEVGFEPLTFQARRVGSE